MNDLLKPFSLEGRVALVTGASSGFGRHFAALLSRAGAKVVVAARRTDLIQKEANKINASGGQAMAVTMDVTSSSSIAAALDEVETGIWRGYGGD